MSAAILDSPDRLLLSSTLGQLKEQLDAGRTTSAELVSEALAAAEDPSGEGARTYTRLYRDTAMAEALHADRRRRSGARGSLLGLPVSIKDSFDVAGDVTTAGSIVLRHAAPADEDAFVVSQLEAQGAIILGRTNMSELGLSGLGINPHWGTPANPYDRRTRRLPGGSSSGAAVSVTDGMAAAAVCSDSGGSARVPAALCGLVGFKPTAGRIPRLGLMPVTSSCDSVGILGRSVGCCQIIDAALSGQTGAGGRPVLKELRFGAPPSLREGADLQVTRAFERALALLAAAGATIDERPVPRIEPEEYVEILAGLTAYEMYRWHERLVARHAHLYDPEVLGVLRAGGWMSALDHEALVRRRFREARAYEEALRYCDYLVMPTVPVAAPPLVPLERDRAARALLNARLLRNASLVNFMDWCALSLPCHRAGDTPVGLTIAGRGSSDRLLLETGRAVEALLAGAR